MGSRTSVKPHANCVHATPSYELDSHPCNIMICCVQLFMVSCMCSLCLHKSIVDHKNHHCTYNCTPGEITDRLLKLNNDKSFSVFRKLIKKNK